MAAVVSTFSIVLGLGIATLVLQVQLRINAWDVYLVGAALAIVSSSIVFGLGAPQNTMEKIHLLVVALSYTHVVQSIG